MISEPNLETKRRELITTAAMELDKTRMIRFDDETGELHTTGNEIKCTQYGFTVFVLSNYTHNECNSKLGMVLFQPSQNATTDLYIFFLSV